MGVQFFSGAMPRCTDSSITTEADCVGDFLLRGDLCAYLPSLAEELACKQNAAGVPFPRLWQTFASSTNYAGESFADTPHSLLVVRNVLNWCSCVVHLLCCSHQVFELLIGENWPVRFAPLHCHVCVTLVYVPAV